MSSYTNLTVAQRNDLLNAFAMIRDKKISGGLELLFLQIYFRYMHR